MKKAHSKENKDERLKMDTKLLRKQLKNVVQAELANVLTSELIEKLRKELKESFKKDILDVLSKMETRQNNMIDYMVRQSARPVAPQTLTGKPKV